MTRFERVQQILDEAVGGATANIGVHQAFWRGITREQFISKAVMGLPLIQVGHGAESNLVKALKGEPPFGVDLGNAPPEAEMSRMPAGMPPVSAADIAFIQKWIDEGCPDGEMVLASTAFQWHPTNAPVASSRTDDIWFLDPNVGWAVNSNGQIVHTQDGGDSWSEQHHDGSVYWRCVGFANGTRGWAGSLTANKTLVETRNGGQTWTPVSGLPALAPPAICGLSVVNDQVVFASGTNFPNRPPRMMKTVDGGQSWTAWDMRPWADILIDCYFTSPTHGWVVGGKAPAGVTPGRSNVKAVVLQTVDGGATWVNRIANLQNQLPSGEWGWKIQFLNEQVGFVSLESFTVGAILKTVDGGVSWTRLPVNDPQGNTNLEGVGFITEQHGWVGGWGDASFESRSSSETFDGGLTWRDANEIGKAINRFRFFGNPVTVGYASGETVYKYSPTLPPPTPALMAMSLNGNRLFNSIESSAGEARLSLEIPSHTKQLSLRIWDRFGDEVHSLSESQPPAGQRHFSWNRTDQEGCVRPCGYFIFRVTADGKSESRIVQIL